MMQPMRAHDLNINELPCLPAFVMPKKNGIRGTWNDEKTALRTRNGRSITGLPHIVDALKQCRLSEFCPDGELYNHTLAFEEINGLVRRKKAALSSQAIEFHIFDFAVFDVPMDVRIEMLKDIQETGCIKVVESKIVYTKADILKAYDEYLYYGYEGLILRTMDGEYREELDHADLFRLKPAYDLEAKLVDFIPHVQGNIIASLILQLPNGKRFRCDGMTAQQRQELYRDKPLGDDITVQYNTLTRRGIPLNPRYKSRRYDI